VQHSVAPIAKAGNRALRPRRTLLAALTGAALVVAAFGMLGDFGDAKERLPAFPAVPQQSVKAVRGPKPPFTVAKETTYLTRPLDKAGYVDYLAALNEAGGKGVTFENNAAVLLVRAMDLSAFPAAERSSFFKLLGVEPPAKGVATIQAFPEFMKGRGVELGAEIVAGSPWAANQFPSLAKWLDEKKKPLDLAIEATRRPRCYFPLFRPSESELSYDLPLPALQISQEIARALTARATLRIKNGKIAQAREDLLACRRLGRLVGSGPLRWDAMVAHSIDDLATRGEAVLLEYGKLSAADALAYRDEVGKLPPLPSIADRLDHGERLIFLGSVCEIVRREQTKWALLFMIPILNDELKSRFALVWDAALRAANRDWDRWVAAMRTPNAAERQKQIQILVSELRPLAKPDLDKAYLKSPREAGRQVGRSWVALMMPDIKEAPFREERIRVRDELLQAGFALAAYRADSGRYPAALDDLVPKYCSEVPLDHFSGKPLHYRRRDSEYLLYSVGEDGRDDGGRGAHFTPPGDDLALRIPRNGDAIPTPGKESTFRSRQIEESLFLCQVFALPLSLVGGLAMLFSRLRGRPRPPVWLVLMQAAFALPGLAIAACAAWMRAVPPFALISPGLFAIATFGGGTIWVASARRKKPIPISLMLGYATLLLAAWLLYFELWR
jgi:hypothetical protein